MGVTRFPYGIGTTKSNDVLRDFGMPDPTKWFCYHNDFQSGKDYDATNEFIATIVGGSVSVAATGEFGELNLSSGAALNNHAFLQLRGNGFTLRNGKKAFYKTRLKINILGSASIITGLQIQDTTPLDFTDGIVFMRETTATSWTAMCRKDATTGATSVTNVGTLAANTYVVLGFYFDGKQTVEYFCDGNKVATINATSAFLPDAPLTVSFGIQTTEAVTKLLTVDYVFAAIER